MGRKIIEESLMSSSNYCLKCWNEFTCLTPDEHESLRQMREFYKKKADLWDSLRKSSRSYPTRPVMCIETKEIYESLKECSYKTGANYCSLSRHLSKGVPTKVKGMRFKYIEL